MIECSILRLATVLFFNLYMGYIKECVSETTMHAGQPFFLYPCTCCFGAYGATKDNELLTLTKIIVVH